MLSDLHMSRLILFYLFVVTFAMKLKDVNYKSNLNNLVFCDQWKMISDLKMPRGKMSDFVSFPLFGFILVIKPRNFDFESLEILQYFWIKKNMTPDLNMSHGKMFYFFSFQLFGFTFVIKLRSFHFESHWNHWNTFIRLNMSRQTVYELFFSFSICAQFWQ